ncbi:hyperosmolarity resistance protein Ebh [Staphylococcus aureus]|uniref:hyperosmolarity resistance protein Ebh n=1 Tax=Staphylococcus aureus TaxID=1280 RepID=UPI001CC970DC|nr:hyperosmolarity resistance protein Ebh [Staphylococcus aureus]MBZ6503511.1 hyperosmolarity resistance protein Ebh [Staphylococcus aureus]MBZ6506105.1 hyperosmolarity resistance protein Ebh [Staphylococcus aureus]MBZ6519400.1 hyperosmolarity resistance protein Ebh [Staphylococcus aureus]MBZ6525012.1 hyperosmolarity resistance protein Ebh [Staphylococcus aureus]
MNYRDKIQKFSIRKYTVGTFSTVIATLVFLGLNTSQAQAAETNQPASALKQKQQNGDTQTENREVEVQNSQNGQSLSAPIENEQPNNNQTNHVDASAVQSSTTEHDQPVSQNEQAKKDTAAATPTQSAKAASKHEQSESRAANKKENDNKATHVESHEANVVTASDSSDSGNVQHDRNELQAFFDANYHDYRFIDRENADSGTFNYVKGIFDKINTLLGSNDPINNKDLQLAYKELEQAVALIRTMPQRQQTSRRSSRIQTRSIESRAAEPRSVSDYQNANSSYYVENANDGSGYPVGTYINASSKGAPYNLPTTPWNTLKASDAKEIALITAKQTGDGYQWVIKFNKGHAPHENMIYWFALPAGQTPVGRTEFVTVNADGTNVQWSNGAGAGANKPLPEMWPYGVNDSRSWDYKIRNRSGQVIYDWPTVHINSLKDLARASDYFSEAGATPATKAFGRQTFEYINGERPTESPGVPKVYTFIGKGDASYTISFKTQGPTIDKLYYAAGGRALEYNQLFMYSQLYVESTQDYQQRLNGLRQVVNRTYRIGTTKRVEVSQGNVQTKKVLESTNLNIDDFMDDPLSYVKTPSNKVLGFYPTSANTNAFRPGGVNPLNEYQLSQLFTDDKLQQAARTGSPIRLMIGFDYPDAFGNGETLVPVNLTVLPEIQHNIKFFKNDDGQNIADKPASKQAGHPVFYVYAGNQGNASVNLGGSVTSIQPLRINLTSNENFTDKDWQITGIPRTLHIENSTNRTNNARERNIELVGNLLPGDYFGTIRFGRKEQLFEIRVKPHTPRITTTAEELRGTALQKVPVTVTDIPLDPSALVYLVIPTSQTRDGGSEADQIPSGYTKIATGTPDGVHSTITIRPEDYVVFIPPVGNQIRALIFYNNVVASNMSNAVTILPDDIPPTINNPVGLNAKYYRGDEVSFTMGVSDRHSGLKSTTITTLPSGWTSNLTKSDKKNGSLAISGRVSMNQAYNSDITFKVSATDNVNNTTNDSQSKHVTVHVGKISDDAHPIVLGNSEKVVVVNPTALTGDEKQRITTAFMNKNQNIRGYLASSNPVTVDNHGNVTLQYRDGSSTTLDATNVMTYEPVVKPEYQTANAAKTATVTIAKGQSFNIGDIKQYFTLSNGQAIPSSSFTNITSDRTIPTAQEVSQMNAGTQLYHIVATNAYHKDTEDFYITLKIIDVKQPEGDQRVYRMSTYDITTDEISKVKQAFINANRDAISFAEGDISVTNTPNGSNVSTITVNINKGRLTKSFTSNLNNMNFLRWVNFPQDYTVTWTNAKIANRPTDGGLSWSDDHKSLIYRYDATLGTQITTNDILTLLKATTTVPGLRNNIAGNEKAQAEAGGRPNYKTTGYSQSNPTSDGQRQFTLNGQVIQIMDIINPSNGFGGQPVTNSNVRANHSNSTVVSVNESAANGAGAFTIDHVVKNNSTHNAADAVYKAQLYLSPYGPKQYVEHLNQNTDNTNEAINIYFVPSDLVNPTISVGNYTNHQVFSGETFTNTITANDNFGVQSVTVPTTSQLTGTVDNNHQHVSATAPNVTSTTNKTINLVATDTSGNTATTSFNVTIKPLRDKYRVGTSSTAANPVRIANISNNATVSQADQTAIINSLTFTSNAPNRNYATASANEITSKTVSNVSRTGNNAQVTVTVTYQDGTTSTVTVPVKRVIPEIVAHSHYTVQGQDFPTGNGASASDYFKLSNGSAIPDATITWVSGQAPNKNNTTIGQDINVTAHILIDGETTPITKTATYKVVRTVPKQVFETARGVLYPGVSDMYDAKQYVKPVNNSWSTNAQHMNFQFTNSYGPSKDVVGISTRDIRVTYDNHQTQIIKILSKVKPDPPRIDGNSVTYKAGLTNQQIKINNVLSSSSIKLFKADNTPLTITNTTYGSGNTAVVTVSDALPNGEIKARSSISMNNVTYTTQDEHGRAIDVTRNESVDSNDSASVHVTPQLQATTEGAVFIKGGDGFDFGHVERFIQNPPHGATVAWHDNPDTWKNTVGNTHKTAVVTLPNGQGTRNVEVPVKVYPVANAKAPSRDVKGQNLTNGTDAINYITFDPNTNTNGITAVWANRQQPNNQQAGVQHLNVDVTYPGISAAKRVPVTVNVYQFEFPQTSYTTTVGGTLASGTQASGYAHIQNATGLPTDGFTYKWNNAATGTNDANWAAMNKPNTAQVINAKYDVIYNGHTFATSLPAKFVVKDVQPAKPTVTETAAGVITIAPGANQTVNTHAGNVTTYADKLVIKRNGNVVTTFTRHNNTSPWVKEASAANVAGIAGTNNGITVAAGTFNPADTIQAVATQGSGETISDEQRSDDFTVVAPQPNQATTKIWQNGHVDITPNNPSGHLINPTQAMDIAYTEKVGNGAEHSKTLNAVLGQNNQWTIANKPDYVTLDAHTGKVTFNANTIKPNSAITITPKAGTGHSASSNPSTLTAPAAHTVNTTEIVKDYGSNVTAAEINNAVQVANKRTATIKNGTAMPTNLAGGSTTTIPVTVTYNDSSTEEVQESIFTKADKRELITAKNHLDDPVSTDGKKPGTITQYNNAIHNAQQQINTAKTEAQQVINDERATPQQVNAALSKVQAAQTKINEAKALLQNKEDNSQLVTSKNNLQSSVNQVPSTTGMTQQSIDNYNAKKREAESEITAAQRVIDNGDATAQQISDEKHRVDNALTALNQAKQNLTADTHELEQAVHQLNRTGTTTGKKPASITAYNNSIRALQSDLTSAKNSANAIIQKPIRSVQEVQTALTNVNRVNDRLTLAINQLVPLADNSALRTAKTKLDEEINKSVTTDGMTQSSIQAYENAKRAGQTESTNAQKEALKQLVQQSTTVAEAQGNEQKANNVDAAMDKLRQSIADNATTKQNQNYTDSSPNKKDAYNNAVTTAQGIIDQTTSPTLDPTVINQAAGQVSTTKNALNGNENLEAAKQQATQSLGSLDNLNNAQKQAVTDQINGAHTVDEANQIKQNAQNLNTAMGNLKQAIADKDATKATVNFTDADQAKQQAYNTAVTNAENIISKANGGNATQTEVEQAIQQVNAAKQALNGNANVQHAKDEATALINSSNDLNQAQKDALKQQVQNATTVAGVNNVKQTAQELNNAMTQLKQGIADKEQTKADGNFVNADPDKQNAYKQAVAKAEALISGTPDVVVTPSEITAALNKVTQAKNDLNGNTNLATTKQNVQHAIDQLPNLNQAQRDEYSKQITQATLVPNVNAIQQAATTLNDAMTQLKQGIANKAQIKGSENYHDADTDKQTAYDNAVTKAEELLKQTTNPTMDPNTIQQALTKVNDTNQALNGNQKLADAKQAAKTNLGTLDHLNDAQKQALTTQVEQAPDIATVNNVKQNAQNLNNAMTNLSNALQDKTETLNSINFTDADQAKKDAYTNAVAHAEGILSKANGSNASQTEVEQAMQRVNEAKQALNGNDNVQRAKDAAKQVITNANDLNQAQKDALKQQVDAAQTVVNVNTIKQTAQDLNQAMTQLKQGIADKDQTKANGNFVNADTDKQNAYNNAVAHAEQIISGTPNANVDPQQVAQALQQVTQAKGDLNGNHNLQVAKDNANTAIDQLPNLNQTQKTALKDQVSHAELVTGVNAIKQNADALNNAMGTLKQQIQANSQVPQSVDFTQADQDKQQAYNNAANQAQQIANGTPTPVLTPDAVTQAVTTMNQAKDALNGDEKLAQAKQDAIANLDTLRDLNQPQRDALRNQINQAQALATVEQTKQNAQNVNTAMSNLKQGIANKDTVKASENYHDADADKQTAYTNAVSQAEGIINQTTNPMLNPDDITRALTQVTDAKNGLNGEAKLATEKQNAKDAVNAMTHLNDAQKQALKGQIDQSPEIAIVNQVKQTATSLDHAMDQLSQAINDKAQTLADGNYLNADPDKQNAYKQAVAKAEALLNKQSGTNEVQAQVESITNEVNAAKQALNGNDNLANAKQQAKQQLANLTHLNDAQKQSFESQITQAPLVTDVTTINQKAQALDHAMELLRNSVADNQATLASEDYHDATAQRQNDYNQAVTATNNIINQTTSPTMNPDEVNRATTQVNNTKVALDGDENLVAAKQQANNRLDQLDHLNNAQKQQLQSQITQSSDIAAVNGHKQTAESLNTAMGNLINAIADHQTVEQLGNFVNADTDKQTAYTTAVNEAEAMINKQTGQNANQTEVEQAITKVQTTLQALNGDHNLQVAKANATQAIDALTSLNDPQKTALKDQVTAATLVTAVHQIEQNANTLNQAMHGLRESIQDNAATKANSKYINEDQSEQQNYDQAVQAANNIINEQTATLDNNAINQAATTVNTTKAALHGDVKLQNDKDHAKQTVSQLTHLNNAQKHMEDTLIDSETTRTAVNHDLTEAQALDQLMDALQQSIADKDATRASSAYVNAEPNKKQSYDEAVQNAESIIAGLNNPTINKGNVTSATQAVTSSKNALDGVERLAQDKQTAGNSLNHLDQLTPAQQQALENQINNATTRDKVAEIIAQAQALNEAMKALKESIKDQPQTEASSKFINEDQAQKDAYTQAVQHAKDLINKTTDPTLAKSIIDQATQAVTDAKNNLHGDQKLDQDKQRATETLNNLSNLNTPQRQALENQINNAATRGEVAQKLTEAEALNQAMEALRNSIQDQQQTEAGSKFINEDKPQKDAYQAAVQNAKDLINQTNNPTLDKAQVEQLTQAVNQAKDNLHGDQKLADDKQHAVTDLNQLNGLNNPQRQALESQINNAATRDEVAQKLAEAKALDQAMQALRNSIQDQQQTESGSKFINEDKPQKDAYQAAVQNAKDLINQTGNPTLDKSQVEQLTQAVTTAKDNLHGDQKLARDQLQAVTTVNALPNLNHAQQQALTDAINAAPTRTEVAQHVQTATELDHAMETLKNKVDQVNTDKAQPNYTEASTDKKEAVDQALQAAESITDPTNGSNANKDAVDQALTKLQEKVNELNGNERVAEAKTQAKQTIDQLTHLNADQIATAKQNIDQATKLQPIAELVDQATQLNQSMDQLQQAVNEHANVEQTVDYTQADLDKQNAYKQAIADAENVLKQNANKQQVDQALQNILNAKQALNGDERVALAKTNGKHDIEQLNALNNAQQDGFKGRIDQSNDLNQIQQIVDEAKALNRVMDQLSQGITGNEGRTKGSTNYVNADTQVKQVYDEAVDKAKQALDKSTGQNLTAEQVIKLNDAVTAAKKALNGEEKLNNRKSEALQRLDQLTHLNNAQRQLAIQQINNAETLNKASRAINRATKLDNAMGAVQQYIDEQHLGVISSTNYINADDNLKANYDNAIANAAHELDKVQGNAIAKAEAEQLKQNIIDAQNALNGDQNLANAKDKANAFVNSLNGLNQQQQHLAHNAINNADTVSDVTDIVNNQIDLNDAMETLKHLVDNEIPNAEQTVNYQNAEDNAKTNFDDAKRLANTLLNSDNTNVNDINGAIQTVNDAIQNLNGDQRLQDAKDKAIQSINQALANKLKEIEASNATDQDKLIAKNKAEELANSIINNINKATSNQDVSQVQTAGNHAIEQVHANEIPKAKIDANKDVDKQVQALIDEIDRNPILTDKEKQALKDRINQILQQGHNDINNAMTKEEIEQAKAQLGQALQDIKDLVKAKESAKQDIDKQVQALIDEIDRNPILTDKEKQALKDRINQILQQGHNGINNAMTKEEIEQAKAQLGQALQDIKDLVKAKESAKQDIDKQVQALIDEIDRNPNLTDKEKQALKDRINQILQQGHNGINNAMTKEEIEHAKAQLAQALQDIKDLVKAKEDAKNAIKALANAKRDQINSNPDLTLEQKAKALKEIDEAEKRALENIENAQTKDQLNQGLNLGLDDIRNTHVWEVDAQPAVNEIFDATPEQILVNGELIVHRDDIITEQDILAHINLIDQLTAEIIDTPSTATISDSLTAKVEVTLLDGSKVIVNVPVKVVEKELTVVKQQAIESIENAAQQKINEINNHATLTPEQKEAAIAEVNKLKQQAIEQINNAADVHTVEEVQHQEQAHIEQFNPDQFTIDQAKSNAIKSISDAIQHMIDEINASKDLTDKEKQEAISKLNQLKDQSIQAIQRAQSIDEIAQQLEQFKAQLKAANPFAKELENRKKAAISKIKDISTDKIDRIRNSTIGTAEERQAAMNRINEIVLETIKDINNAQTPQQVEAALNNGIARILAVQIVTSDHSKPSSNSDGQSNSHLHVGYGTVNHPFNSSPIGHKKKLDQDDEIDPLHMRHFGDRIGNVIKNALGVVGISGLLASFWFFIAKRRRKEDEEEELEIRDNSKDKKKGSIEGTKHLPLLFAKRRRKEDEEDAIVEEKDSLNNDESLDKVKHTPFFLPKRRRKEDEEDVEVTNENTDEKVLQDNEHSPVLIAKRLKDKDGNVETTTSIESKDEDVPLLLAKKKNQKDNQSKGKKSASKKPSKKVAAKKKKKKSKKNKK